jgi:acyl-CoA thioester hydrolase
MGVVYHANYLQYFDMGRTEYLRECGLPYADLEKRGYVLAVVDVGVKYRKSAHYDEELVLITRIASSSRAAVTFSYELFNPEGLLLTSAHTRLACLGPDKLPAVLPPDLRDLVENAISAGRKDADPPSESP